MQDNYTTSENLQSTAYRALIPFHILFDKTLTANQLKIYGLIEQMESNPRAKPYFSFKWLAHLLGINERNAKRNCQVLVNKNYIEHVQIKNNRWVWRTVKEPIEVEQEPSRSNTDQKNAQGVSREDTPGVSREDTQNTQKYKNPEDNNIYTASDDAQKRNESDYQEVYYEKNKTARTPEERVVTQQTFDLFWSLYPRKKDKKKAFDIWERRELYKDFEMIMRKLSAQIEKDAQYDGGQFTPYPTTYLRNDRWMDDITTKVQRKGELVDDYSWGDLSKDVF